MAVELELTVGDQEETMTEADRNRVFAGIAMHRGRVLLRASGRSADRNIWGFPVGERRADESPEEAVVRVTREQTGAWVSADTPLSGDFHFGEAEVQCFALSTSEFSDVVEDDSIKADWFTPERAKELLIESGAEHEVAALEVALGLYDLEWSERKPATRDDRKTAPMPEKRARLPEIRREFSERELEQIRRGFCPRDMEDRWFVFMEGDRLYLHRSWTGFCIYEAVLSDEGRILEAWANRDPDQHENTDVEKDAERLLSLIDAFMLRPR